MISNYIVGDSILSIIIFQIKYCKGVSSHFMPANTIIFSSEWLLNIIFHCVYKCEERSFSCYHFYTRKIRFPIFLFIMYTIWQTRKKLDKCFRRDYCRRVPELIWWSSALEHYIIYNTHVVSDYLCKLFHSSKKKKTFEIFGLGSDCVPSISTYIRIFFPRVIGHFIPV